jgi:hypothetical protein
LIHQTKESASGRQTPAYKLEVDGALRLRPSVAPTGANGVIYYDSTDGKFKCFEGGVWKDCIKDGAILGSGTTNYLAKWTGSETLGSSIIYDNGANVGIGTTAPAGRLQVSGGNAIFDYSVGIGTATPSAKLHSLATNEQLRLGYDDSKAVKFTVSSTNALTITPLSDTTSGFNFTNAAGTSILNIDTSNQRVGIGTTTPAYKLEVDGALRLRPSVAPTGANGVIYYDSTDGKFKCFEGGVWKDCIKDGAILGSGTTNYLAKWTGSETLGSSIIYDNGANVGIGTTAPAGRLQVSGGNAIFDYSVGIGTATPSAKLHSLATTEQLRLGYDASNAVKFTVDSTNALTITPLVNNTSGFNFTNAAGTSILNIDTSNQRVGIGTTAPAYKLEVDGALRLRPSVAPTGANGVIYYDSTDGKFKCFEGGVWKDCIKDGAILGSGTTNYLAKWTGSETLGSSIIYDNGANVGIGTTAPAGRLQVSGGNAIFDYSVGIGTATPSAKLHSLATTEQLRLGYDDSKAVKFTVDSTNALTITPLVNTTSGFNFTNAAGTSILNIDTSNQRVGIGTTAPSQKLHVVGNALITGTGTFQTSPLTIGNLVLSHTGLTASRTFTFPDVSDTLVSLTATQTLTNKTLSTGSTWQGNVISTTYGGTGLSSYTAGDILYYSSGTSLSKLPIGASGTILTSSGSAPQWSTLSSLNIVTGSGTLNTIAKWTGTNSLGNSIITDDGSLVTVSGQFRVTGTTTLATTQGNVGIGTTNPTARLYVDAGAPASNGIDAVAFVKTRSATNSQRYTFADVGGLTSDANGAAFWRGFHLAAPTITDPSGGANVFPRLGFFSEYNSLTAPSTRNWVIQPGNDTATSRHKLIIRTGAGTDALTVDTNGNVGIGTTAPAYKLDVASAGSLTARFGTNASDTVVIGDGAGKLSVGTFDPVYNIDGKKFATYGLSTIGIKEETVGTIKIERKEEGKDYYFAEIDFNNLTEGSDLWLFSKITALKKNINKLSVFLTPNSRTHVWYQVDPENFKLYFFAEKPTIISYRLIAPRFDFEKWKNTLENEEGITGLVVEEDGEVATSSFYKLDEENNKEGLLEKISSLLKTFFEELGISF